MFQCVGLVFASVNHNCILKIYTFVNLWDKYIYVLCRLQSVAFQYILNNGYCYRLQIQLFMTK